MHQLEKIQAVIEYIEEHLTQKLDMNEIAGAVFYSRYYLQRIFSQTVGMTIHDYLQRRQLTEAAKLLVFSDMPILDIAMLAGYESQQAFTTVFSAMYKQTPYQFRISEEFYPLQLKFQFERSYPMLKSKQKQQWRVEFACEADIPCWMELVRLVIDGFPHLDEEQYIETLRDKIHSSQALILKDGETAIGIMMFSYRTGSIEFMGTHPLYRQMGVPEALLNRVMGELIKGKEISITTFREGDKADIGHRREIIGLGFAEAELLVEYGYPTQRFVLPKEESND